FLESYHAAKFREAGIDLPFVQDNHSHSKRHVVRGLHYQVNRPQGKLVRVVAGSIFDVAVDIRPGSPTRGRWCGMELSAENRRQSWIPPGLAHGFLVTSPVAEVLYKTTDYYDPASERCIIWNDPTLAIAWPLTGTPIVSAKDARGEPFV
ncbi:MAG: dTDP-4-dehydrorhamnose 3,5-epimerase, partial [Planctomycetia bacterium]